MAVKANIYTAKGIKKGTFNLPREFSEEINPVILSQSIRVYLNRLKPVTSKTKTRAEVKISKRKIYRQKGTGQARHGAKSAPIFVGGGIAHGPKGIKKALFMPKKMRNKALYSALSIKAKEAKVSIIEGLSSIKKTKEASSLLEKILPGKSSRGKGKTLVVLSEKNLSTSKYFNNIKNAESMLFRNLNSYKVYVSKDILIDADVWEKKPKAQKTAKKKVIKERKDK